eukprot:scaffold81193_cov68-Attheya_sp.AAC.1
MHLHYRSKTIMKVASESTGNGGRGLSLKGLLHLIKRVTQPKVGSLISTPDLFTFVAFHTTPGTKKMREPINLDSDYFLPSLISLPGTLDTPTAPVRLLSPQHWSQQANDNHPLPRGTWCATYQDSVMLHWWGQRKFARAIPLCPRSNVGRLRSAPRVQ